MNPLFRLLGTSLSVVVLLSSWAIAGSDIVPEHPYVTEYKRHLTTLQTSFEVEDLQEAISHLAQTPTKEAYERVAYRLENIPDVTEVLEIPDLKKAIKELLRLMLVLGSKEDIDLMKDFADWVRMALLDREVYEQVSFVAARLSQKPKNQLVTIDKLNRDLLQSEADGRSIQPRTLSLKIDPQQKAHEAALREVHQFYRSLRKRVVGQEPILRSMETLYLQDLLKNGLRQNPEIFYMMGLPGNGKDTIVEAYVDALWDKPGAHEDHMFRMNIRNKAEAWSYFGSGKGYVGSGDLPELLRFLVMHSGGKYVLAEQADGNNKRLVVERNPEWTPQMSAMSIGPHKAVIFVNEAHNIPKEVKDNVLKQAIERGIFPITNPGSGPNAVSNIRLPVTFVFASNEGIDLLEPRQRNGSRVGAPLSYQEVYDNYLRVYEDKQALKAAILKNNGGINDARGPEAPGTSEEFLNRIPNHRLHLLEPLSPEQLITVAKLLAKERIQDLLQARGRLGSYRVEISEEMYEFITSYRHIAAENARPIKARLDNFIFEPLFEGIRLGRIRATGGLQTVQVAIHQYENGAYTTQLVITDEKSGEVYQFTRLIRETLKDVPQPPLPIERIQELTQMRDRMLQNVFGVEHIVDRLLEAAIVSESESRNAGQSSRPATVMAFLGKSSTGKTETAKQYVKARYGADSQPVIIDFNGVRSLDAMEAKILGSYDANKNPIASEFMKQYDRAQGKITFIFDEAANAPRELLKALYEITREASPSGFTDGKARPMNNVTIILTGNAGEQIYGAIPPGLPKDVQERAMHEVFKTFIRDQELQHRILLETFPEALLARLGQNIFHFGPLHNDGKRQIAQLKLLKGLDSLKPKRSERGWHLGFSHQDDLVRLFDMIEKDGFRLNEQGASIDKFVRESIIDKIKTRLLLEAVPNGQEVLIQVAAEPIIRASKGVNYTFRNLILHDAFGREFVIEIPTGQENRSLHKTDEDRVLTAYHEAGHEIVSNVYFGDRQRATYLSIIEGVALIGKKFIPYNGVRMGENETDMRTTKEVVLRQAAVLAAGYVAQQLVTMGGRHDDGKSNDMLRATTLIQNAILRYGLSDQWGMRAIPDGVDISDYIDKQLTLAEKQQLNEITNQWLKEAERLAREALWINFDQLFINMSKAIASQGHLVKEEIQQLYADHGVVTERDGATYDSIISEVQEVVGLIDRNIQSMGRRFHNLYNERSFQWEQAQQVYDALALRERGLLARWNPLRRSAWQSLSETARLVAASQIAQHIATRTRDAHLVSADLMPESVANIDGIMEAERTEMTEPVTQWDQFTILDTEERESPPELEGPLMCRQLF
jgi:ATP-dependent Clp protease ATP-binding subunit ClpA